MLLHIDLTVNAVHIVIVNKGIQLHPPVDTAVLLKFPSYGMGDLKVIVVIVSGIDALVKFIIRNTVQHFLSVLDVSAVVSVDDLPHKPEVLFLLTCAPAHFLHEAKVKTIRAVQADAVNIKGIDPLIYHIQKITFYFRVLQV